MPVLRTFTMENVQVQERATVSGMTVAMHWGGLGIGALFAVWMMDLGQWNILMVLLVSMFMITIFLSRSLFRPEFARRRMGVELPAVAGGSR